jgi:sterol desaturase/sphingolipid hydroxylase (fatty acid hydroxylase superfamily)
MPILVGGVVSGSAAGVTGVLQRIFEFLVPLETIHAASLSGAFLEQLWRMTHSGIVFALMGLGIYALSLGRWGRSKLSVFSYALPVKDPGENFSFSGAARFLFPKSFYGHPSFKLDLISLPLSIAMGFYGLLGLTLGSGAVQGWLLHRFGHSPVYFPEGLSGNILQVVVILLARDFGRFLWHYQGHTVPFFWEFHKGHHSIEVLHPLGVRTHPVDMFIRNTYTGVGGALISGALIYLLGWGVRGRAWVG